MENGNEMGQLTISPIEVQALVGRLMMENAALRQRISELTMMLQDRDKFAQMEKSQA